MNKNKYCGVRKFLLFGTIASALAVSVLQSPAQIVTLTDNNSVARINTASSAGMFDWIVDGSDQLAQQWFWFRVGAAGGEAPINTISAPSIVTPTARNLSTTYNNPGAYSVKVDYQLNGATPGSGTSGMNESVTILNQSASPLSFHFYQYTDFDLVGGPNSVQLSKNNFTGLYSTADQVAPGITFQESLVTPGANHGEATLFPATLNSLNDGNPTTLTDVNTAGPGDTAYAFEWDLTIAANSSFVINKSLSLQLTPVPEPSALALISVGLAGLALRKRRSSV